MILLGGYQVKWNALNEDENKPMYKRSIKGDVIYSTFEPNFRNTMLKLNKMVLERAKRLTEQGKDVVILLE